MSIFEFLNEFLHSYEMFTKWYNNEMDSIRFNI